MAGQQQDLDANEPATSFKLEKAHKRGSIFRSAELVFACVLLVCVACVYGLGMRVVDGIALVLRRGLSFAARDGLTAAAALAYIGALAKQAALVLAPVVFVVWVTALLVSALQARGVFSAHPLIPDFTRLNPATGLKRLFSIKSLHELARSGAKLAVIGAAMTIWGRHQLPGILHLSAQNPRSMARSGLDLLGSSLTLLAGLIFVFAILD